MSLGDAEAVGTITDDDGLTVSVAGPGANVEEGQTATFTVTVTGTSTTAVVVSYEVDTDASTAAAADYTAPSETELTIGAGVASGTIEVVTNTDAVLEPDETLVLKLTGASTAGEVGVSTTAATAQATIEDKGAVTVSVKAAQASEGESVQFDVELSGAVSSEVKVSYATSADGTGANPAAGTDYTAVSATELTFRPGEALRQTVSVATAEDELNEADETFTLRITGPDPEVAGVSLGDAEAVGTITDDDELTVSVAGPGANVEEGQTATFTVTVTGTSTTAVVVSYEVDTGASTATAADYTAPSETELTIGAGVASGTIEVVTNTDAVLEPDETLVLKLTGASTAGEVGVSTTAATAQATIEDKGAVTVSVKAAQASEGDSVQFEVELSGAVSSEVKVSYATSDDGTGANPAAGTDYTAVSATELTFRPGEALRQTVSVATVEDELNEADETFKLRITGAGSGGRRSESGRRRGGGDDHRRRRVDGERGRAWSERGRGTDGDVHGDGDRDEHDGGGGELRGGHRCVDGDGRRLHGAERDGADDWRWSGERDDRGRDEHGRGAGAGRDAGVEADRSEHGW